ncbi:MAG: hypothetical protein MCM46_10985 [Candidatus Manganitrophus sp. SB1]|nr:hypothetical protein [Candidatus Manganitrophus morganii]
MEKFVRIKGGGLFLAGLLLMSVLSTGCAGKQKGDDFYPVEAARRAEVSADAASYGHPFRLLAFVLHPVGVLLDYVIVRPIYYVASVAPSLFGYTAEDEAAFEKQRERY